MKRIDKKRFCGCRKSAFSMKKLAEGGRKGGERSGKANEEQGKKRWGKERNSKRTKRENAEKRKCGEKESNDKGKTSCCFGKTPSV